MQKIQTPAPQRNFKQEFEDKVRELKSTPELFDGTKDIKSLKRIADLMLPKLRNLNVSQFRLPLLEEMQRILDGKQTETDMVTFMTFVNFVTEMTPIELNCLFDKFVTIQQDIRTITENYSKTILHIKEPLEKEAIQYAERQQVLQAAKMNPKGKMKIAGK